MTASKEHLQNMFEFVRWADGLMIRAARTVPDDGYYREQGISLGSIHKPTSTARRPASSRSA